MELSSNHQPVLYRKWRPRKFDDLVGQEPIVKTLQNAIQNNQSSHAYLFTGPRGTGKTTAGRIFAATINCQDKEIECIEHFFDGSALSLIELDAASNRGIDEIRNLKENIAYMVGENQFKVYLIDEVHMLTDAAFNALLKTLEEPPAHVIFILATTEPHKVPATVHSRCQRYDFKKINPQDTITRLAMIADAESISINEDSLKFIARLSEGSLRDAINILEQVSILIDDKISIENMMPALGVNVNEKCTPFLVHLIKHELQECLAIILNLYDGGINFKTFRDQLIDSLRSSLYAWDNVQNLSSIFLNENDLLMIKQASSNDIEKIIVLLKKISLINFQSDSFYPLPLEIVVADICRNANNDSINNINLDIQAPVLVQPKDTSSKDTSSKDTSSKDTSSKVTLAKDTSAEPTQSKDVVDNAMSHWNEIKSEARNNNNKAGALMNSGCFVKSIVSNKMTIGFKFATHVDLVKNSDNGKVFLAIKEAVNKVLKSNLELEIELADQGISENDSSESDDLINTGKHLVDEALKRGAKIID